MPESHSSAFNRLTFRLSWHGFFVFRWTFEQQLFGVELAIIAHPPGHDRLGFVAQQVGLYAGVNYLKLRTIRIYDRCVQHGCQPALGLDLLVIAGT